jgi:hypothetical protein
MSDATPNLENAYFLDDSTPCPHTDQDETRRESRQDAKRATDAVEVVVYGGTNVEPNHHHGHRAGGGFPGVWFRLGTIRQVLEVSPRA